MRHMKRMNVCRRKAEVDDYIIQVKQAARSDSYRDGESISCTRIAHPSPAYDTREC